MRREQLQRYLDELLEAGRFRDYCPNGLQVEGRAEIRSVVCGVTASQALLDVAVCAQADAILVHHGWFWRGEDGRVVGIRRARLATLLRHDINLFAYHLPLDAHPEVGNNAVFGRAMGWSVQERFGEQDLGCVGGAAQATTAGELAAALAERLQREPLLIGDRDRAVRRVAWCTGAAQGLFEQAIAAGADAYVSGEISEQTVHLARESGVAYLCAGHHATERFGIQALAHRLQTACGLACRFVDVDNPV